MCREQPIEGFLDDYSFLIKGLIDFYVATLDVDALKWAKDLQDTQDRLFWDNERGGYFYSQANSANVVVRLKEGLYNSCNFHQNLNIFIKFLKCFFFLIQTMMGPSHVAIALPQEICH